MILGFGPWEICLLLVLLVALFGLGRLPKILGELGRVHGTVQRVKNEFRNLFRWF